MSGYAVPTGRELEAVYGPAFREARDRGRDPTPAHFDALQAVASEVADYFESETRALARLTTEETT